MTSETCLSCEGIERYLGEEEERVHALRGVSLDIEPGSIHAVVGPSGCGKSSLLYILGLLDLPDAGRVSIESEPVSQLSDDELAYKRSKFIGFIFQFHFLMEDFTAQENVMIPMRKLGKLSDSEMRERAASLLESVSLGDKLRRPSRHLSGGEQWPSPARWPTTLESFWPTNQPATSILPTLNAPLSCCRPSYNRAGKPCSLPPIIRSSPNPAIGSMK